MNSKCKAILSVIMMAVILTISGFLIVDDLSTEGTTNEPDVTLTNETAMNYLSPVSVNVFTIDRTSALTETEDFLKYQGITGGTTGKLSFVTKLAGSLRSTQTNILTSLISTGSDIKKSFKHDVTLQYFINNQQKNSSIESTNANNEKNEESEVEDNTVSRLFDSLFITDDSKITSYLNVRNVPGGDVVGRMYPGTSGHIMEVSEGWAKVVSGNVTGWVDIRFLIIGQQIISLKGTPDIVVDTDRLMLRSAANTDSAAIDVLTAGTVCKYLSCENGWVYVSYRDMRGYLSVDFVHSLSGNTAVTEAEAQAAEAQAAAEAAAAQAAAEAAAQAQAEAEAQAAAQAAAEAAAQAQAEAEAAAAAEAQAQAAANAAAQANDNIRQQIDAVYSQGRSVYPPIYLSADELYLMASVIMMEAGYENYDGKLAVAGVILNRLRSGLWGNSIRSVVYAPGQFTGANTGLLDSFMAAGPNAESVQAAIEACAGIHNIGGYMYFCSLKSANYSLYSSYVIVDHQCFYQK